MSWDWDTIEKEAKGNAQFKNYAPCGSYEVEVAKITITDNPDWKSPALHIEWVEDDQYKYPHSTRYWLSLGNDNYRRYFVRAVLMELGIAKERAQEAIERAEKDTTRANMVKAYQETFNRAASRHPLVKVTVREQLRDGKPVKSNKGTPYTETVFANPDLQFSDKKSTPLGGEEAADLSASDIPF